MFSLNLTCEYDSPEELLQIAGKLDGQLYVHLEMIRNYRSMLPIIEFGDQSRASNFQLISHWCEVCKSVVWWTFPQQQIPVLHPLAQVRFYGLLVQYVSGFPDEWLPDELKEGNPLAYKDVNRRLHIFILFDGDLCPML